MIFEIKAERHPTYMKFIYILFSMEILTVHDMDRSQGSLRDEYNQLLNKIESLATTREEEEDA